MARRQQVVVLDITYDDAAMDYLPPDSPIRLLRVMEPARWIWSDLIDEAEVRVIGWGPIIDLPPETEVP